MVTVVTLNTWFIVQLTWAKHCERGWDGVGGGMVWDKGCGKGWDKT